MSIFVLNIPVDLQDQKSVSQNLESDPIHNKKGNDGMDRLAKTARTQLCKVVELAKPAKMVKGSPVSQICKM